MNAQQLINLIKERRSVRAYKEEPISSEVLEKLIEAAIWAPSSCNRQPWFFVIVTEKEQKTRIASAVGGQKTITNAPVVIIVTINLAAYEGVLEHNVAPFLDAGVALENILLIAHSMGIGACPIAGRLQEDIIRDALDIPKTHKIMGLVTLGIPQKLPQPPEREAITKYYSLNLFKDQKQRVGQYEDISLQRKRLSRLGGDVSNYYRRPAERIDLFRYAKTKIQSMISGKNNVLFTYAGLGYFLEGMPEDKVSSLVSSEDERWFIREFKGLKHNLIVSSPLELPATSVKYDCIVSFFDLHFMDDQETAQFIKNINMVMDRDTELILVFLNRHSWYGLNFSVASKLGRISTRIRLSGLEKPLSINYVISKIPRNYFSVSNIETGAFMPIPNVAYSLPMMPYAPSQLTGSFDFSRNVPFLRRFGNVCFLKLKRRRDNK